MHESRFIWFQLLVSLTILGHSNGSIPLFFPYVHSIEENSSSSLSASLREQLGSIQNQCLQNKELIPSVISRISTQFQFHSQLSKSFAISLLQFDSVFAKTLVILFQNVTTGFQFEFSKYKSMFLELNERGFIWNSKQTMQDYCSKIIKQFYLILFLDYQTLFSNHSLNFEISIASHSKQHSFTIHNYSLLPFATLQTIIQSSTVLKDYQLAKLFWTPVLISEEHLSSFSAGCSYCTKTGIFIQIHPLFAKSSRLAEVVQHEIVHCARFGLESTVFEEEFCYQTSPSAVRRYFSPIVQHSGESQWFALTALLSMSTDFKKSSKWMYWLSKTPFLSSVAYGMARLAQHKATMKRALQHCSIVTHKSALLVRLNDQEITVLAHGTTVNELLKTDESNFNIRNELLLSYLKN